MAGLSDSDAAEMQAFLEQKYNTPSPSWLAGLQTQFALLQALLEQGSEPNHDESSNDDDSDDDQKTSPSAARAAALPVVKLIYRTHLIGKDEYLICHAFGTISQNTFEDIFWQKVDEVNNETSDSGIEVYAAGNGKFEFRFGGYCFDIAYTRWEELVRSYSNVLEAPVEFLKTREGDLVYAQLSRTREVRAAYDDCLSAAPNPDVVRIAYYYLRAYAIERGAFCNGNLPRHDSRYFQTQQILVLVKQALQDLRNNNEALTTENVAAKVFKNLSTEEILVSLRTGSDPLPEQISPAMTPVSQSVLARVRALPMQAKMDFPVFIKIDVEYNGSSSIQHGKHLVIIEEQVQKLRNNFLASIQRPMHKVAPPSCIVWPSRLVEESVDSNKASNWVYLVGWKYHTIDQSNIQNITESWTRSITSHDEFDTSSCFISATLLSRSDLTTVLHPTTTAFRRAALPGPKRAELPPSSPPTTSKPSKKSQKSKPNPSTTSNSEPSTSLRQASHVLHRLKHDPVTYDIDDFKVGYEDRFGGLKVKPAAEWQTDQQHKEFIPEHRIVFFERCAKSGEAGKGNGGKGEIMWDKRTRVDLFFRSGKSGEN
ncbi:hypothetical protein VTL71DRAFT_8564 [Oculimacula yallundae]|uniref:MJ1316 RNA cyclic group end recognition domain-containing protein n=1 Tax=Oculimacula yallundae TaxID=86028 RepID=A0ABR4CXY3_9HELO